MKIVRVALRSFNDSLSHRLQRQHIVRNLSTNAAASGVDDEQGSNSFESTDEFEQRIFGGSKSGGSKSDAFFQSLDRLARVRDRDASKFNGWNSYEAMDGLDESFSTIEDGMDGKLKKAATYFEHDDEEIMKEDYSFRPDMTFRPGMTYETKDLDLTKPGVRKPFKKWEFEVTTEEVLRKADFRNVRFLANFITEAGIIIKRSQTRISAKAQRKVAREIKTARAFGLMPFTTMGTKSFAFGQTMENLDSDYEYENYDGHEPDA